MDLAPVGPCRQARAGRLSRFRPALCWVNTVAGTTVAGNTVAGWTVAGRTVASTAPNPIVTPSAPGAVAVIRTTSPSRR